LIACREGTGVAASFRFKHLFLCESLVFNVGDAANGWLEFFYPALKPWVHYIPLRDDMADAELKLRWAMDPGNEPAVRKIARNGFELIRDHLRNDDVKDYWRYEFVTTAKIALRHLMLAATWHNIDLTRLWLGQLQ
jgi:protein glucosyltransferase